MGSIVWIFAVLLILYLVLLLLLRCRKGNETWASRSRSATRTAAITTSPRSRKSCHAWRSAGRSRPWMGRGVRTCICCATARLAVFHDSDLKRCANVEGHTERPTSRDCASCASRGRTNRCCCLTTCSRSSRAAGHHRAEGREGQPPRAGRGASASGWIRIQAISASSRSTRLRLRMCGSCGPRHLPRAAEHGSFEGAVGIAVVSAFFDDERPAELVHAAGFLADQFSDRDTFSVWTSRGASGVCRR